MCSLRFCSQKSAVPDLCENQLVTVYFQKALIIFKATVGSVDCHQVCELLVQIPDQVEQTKNNRLSQDNQTAHSQLLTNI